jgi:3-methyladenine DNA glycosylase AlkC
MDEVKKILQYKEKIERGESEYVRKSAGNALRDISRKHKTLVANEVQTWDTPIREYCSPTSWQASF